MLMDKLSLFADDLAYGGTPTALDLGTTMPQKGRMLEIWIMGTSMAGVTGVTLNDGTTSSPATARATVNFTAAQMNNGPIRFSVPSNTQRYVTLALIGTVTAGTWSAGVTIGGAQMAD